jgi:AcrR family transcriptional regulator
MPRAKLRTETMREEVLTAAMDLLERDRLLVTARAVAAAADTSTAAVYELFGDKAGLLRAVFYEAFHQLRDALGAVPSTPDSRADLVALLRATRVFATRHPMLFEIMFARPFAELKPDASDVDAAADVMRMVLGAVRRAIDARILAGAPRDVAHVLVAANRGFLAAELSGLAGSTPASVERRWTLGIDALLDGLAPSAR